MPPKKPDISTPGEEKGRPGEQDSEERIEEIWESPGFQERRAWWDFDEAMESKDLGS